MREVLSRHNLPYTTFMDLIQNYKNQSATIASLRALWTHPIFGRCLRMLSHLFMQRHSLHYIFNSRVEWKRFHLKHRVRLLDAIGNPEEFYSIREH